MLMGKSSLSLQYFRLHSEMGHIKEFKRLSLPQNENCVIMYTLCTHTPADTNPYAVEICF